MDAPLVSIGLPAYNGERYISETLQSLMEQDYTNLEVIISDDCSTDKTEEICKRFEVRHPKVRYYRNDKRLGMFPNFNQAFHFSHGEYFMWIGQHDTLDKNFVSACVEKLTRFPEAVLCSGQFDHPDENNNLTGISKVDFDTRGMAPHERFRKMLYEPRYCFAIYSLIRSSALRKTHLFLEAFFSDSIFFAELSLYGDFCSTSKAFMHMRTFLQRDSEESENEFTKVTRLITPARNKSFKGLIMARFPFAHSVLTLLRTVVYSDRSVLQKPRLALIVLSKWKVNVFREFTTRWIPRRTRKFLKQHLGLGVNA